MASKPSRRSRLLYRDDGQALTELSLTVGFLCLMLLAVWQVGTVFSNYIDLSEAARDGARAAALTGAPTAPGDSASLNAAVTNGKFAAVCSIAPSPCTAQTVNTATTSTSIAGLTVTIVPITSLGATDPAGTTWAAGSKVRATVSAPYSLSLFGIITVASGTMSVTDDMRVHRQGS
jgi:Flp pilus assembly protein TadG